MFQTGKSFKKPRMKVTSLSKHFSKKRRSQNQSITIKKPRNLNLRMMMKKTIILKHNASGMKKRSLTASLWGNRDLFLQQYPVL